MEGSKLKTQLSASEFELETQQLDYQAKVRFYHMINSFRVILTAVGFAAGVAALGLSADALLVYNNTHVPAEFLLPLWPENFDLRPTHALIAGGIIVMIANGISLLVSLMQVLRKNAIVNKAANLGAPAVSFIAAIVAMAMFYSVNASTTVDTIQSWTCRWQNVSMMQQPYFGTLCKESQAGLALSILLVPLEAIVLGVAVFQMVVKKQLDGMVVERRVQKQASPALS